MVGSNRRGFTLLEILLVVAAIAILAGIIIVAINPARQLGETRDAQRQSDVNAISSALQQYYIKYAGFPAALPEDDGTCSDKESNSEFGFCIYGTDCSPGYSLDDLTPNFINAIPADPSDSNDGFSGYVAFRNSTNRVYVCAPGAEQGTISVKR